MSGETLDLEHAAIGDRQSPGSRAGASPRQALEQVLAGSGLVVAGRVRGHWQVRALNAQNLGGVHTTATVAGMMTEGSGSYTSAAETTATRLPLSLRETPQTVSVITRAQMDDFGLDNASSVLANTTGVHVEKVETTRIYYSARGFDITNFLVDGVGMPLVNGAQWGDMDTALYDHVEVLRGANGLLSFTGNPSATINFVRKRPTADFQGSASLTLGSWNRHRLDLDLSGPLNQSGSVRGRLIAADEHTDSYLDRYSLHKQVISGLLEADVGADTTLSGGITYQRNQPKGVMWGALPLYYTDGSPTHYARSASTAADWSYWNNTDLRAFAELEHHFANGWSLKATASHRRFTDVSDLFYVYGTPDRQTGLGLFSYPSHYSDGEKQDFVDVSAHGNFSLGGRQHQLVAGVNWARDRDDEISRYGNDIGTPLPPLSGWDGDYPKPAFNASSDGANFDIHRRSAYLTARWNLADAWKLITGDSLTHIQSTGANYGVPHRYQSTRNTPFAGLVYDIDQHLSAYTSYARIFSPQTEIDADNRVLAPITGSNLEAGIKGAWFDQHLNASLAVFRTRQNHTAEQAGFNPDTGQSYYRGINATSRGYELEIAGRLAPGWQLTGGYTQLGIVGDDDANVRTYVPRRTAHLATSLRVPGVPALKVGANLRWQGDIYRDQAATDTQGREIFTRQSSYLLVGLMANLQLAPDWQLTLNVDNLTNRKYINSLYWDQNFYGPPRHWSLRVDWHF
nr:TonB-dependent siderophore receptor [Oleiagrimonas sp. C23AA]